MLVGFGQGPRVFDGRIQGRTGQVHAGRTPVRVKDLGFEPGQDTHGLCVALEAADIAGDVGERTLPVVPERRVTKVMGQTGAVDHVRITAEQCADLATDLGDFQRMRQSSASEIVGTGNQNLAFRAQTPQSGRMNQSRAIAFESRARLGFGRLGCPSLLVEGAVALVAQHLFPIQSRFHMPSIGTHIGRSNPDFPNMCH